MGITPDTSTTAVVIVDHGSRRAESNRYHEEFVRDWSAHDRFSAVEAAHMELAEPTIATAFDACVAAGATTVVVAPYFLWPGDHWDRDIPELAAAAASRHPGVAYLVSAPLGPHPALGEIVAERVDRCLAHASDRSLDCELCAGSDRCSLRP